MVNWDYFRADGRDPAIDDSGSYNVAAPGVTIEFKPDDNSRLFAGLHRGVSLLSPGSARSGLDPEESDSFEAGIKTRGKQWYGEAVVFHTKFNNLVARQSDAGGNPVGGDKNIGEITTRGLELLLSTSLYNDSSIRVPLTFACTLTEAEFDGGTASGNVDATIFAGAVAGNELPYVPQIQWNVTSGVEGDHWGFHVGASYVDDSFGDGSNRGIEMDTAGNPDARFGKVDSYFLIDLSINFQVSKSSSVFASMQNALDERWLASRIPHGPRPGAPRQTAVGVEWRF